MDYVFRPQMDDMRIEGYDPPQALAEVHGDPPST